MNLKYSCAIYGLLPHPSSNRVLLIPTDDGWSLPRVQFEEAHFFSPVLASRELSQTLGLPVIAVRYFRIDDSINRKEGYFV